MACKTFDISIHSEECKEKQSKITVYAPDDIYHLDSLDEILPVLRQYVES